MRVAYRGADDDRLGSFSTELIAVGPFRFAPRADVPPAPAFMSTPPNSGLLDAQPQSNLRQARRIGGRCCATDAASVATA